VESEGFSDLAITHPIFMSYGHDGATSTTGIFVRRGQRVTGPILLLSHSTMLTKVQGNKKARIKRAFSI